MGIPSFYRWLIDRYPLSVVEAIEESPFTINGVTLPLNTTSPNPNKIEFDNLYLDMNGIIHPCFHPENSCPPKSFDEVFQAVFKYIDRLFSIIRPRKILYMAIDGVAPRAKMNQQRARRFRAAKDLAGQKLPDVTIANANEENGKLDSNIITPGTEFMELLSSALRYYIHLRMNNDPGWKGVKVILSDASVPGEGEHKIVSFIRLQRDLPGFDPNTRHCLYGLDADLIMLALATHEVHFTVLREDVSKPRTLDQSNRLRTAKMKLNQGENFADEFDKCFSGQVFQLVRIWVLRDYLALELQIPDLKKSIDFERLIDDFVFMCIFVGNDFLPHIPSLEIGEGAIDLLMMIYKKEFVQMGGYLTLSSEVNLERVEHFIKAIATYETYIFRKRNLVSMARGQKERSSQHSSAKRNSGKTQERKDIKAEDNLTIDQVNFGEDGWRERYYALKFEVKSNDEGESIRKDAVNKYVEGICWVMHYYYQGICSWNWFYPYHYAPFASDFHDIGQLEIRFDVGRPLKPFDQLMGVLPSASAHALPLFYRRLMTDPSSPILDFYPKDFEVDLNGKKHSWQGVCKLPFINEFRLLTEIAKVEHTLTESEERRNSLGQDALFIYQAHPLATIILSFLEEIKNNPKLPDSFWEEINPIQSGGMNGYVYIPGKSVCPVEVDSPVGGMEIITNNKVISVFYEAPLSHPHISKLPDGLVMPGKFISKDDVHPPAILWHERTAVMGNRCYQRPKPSNCISGPSLGKISHRLVADNCGGKPLEVVSEMWQRWLNRRRGETNIKAGLTTGGRSNEGAMRRVEEMWKRHSTCVRNGNMVGKRKRDVGDVPAKDPKNCKRKELQSPGGDIKKNDMQFSRGNTSGMQFPCENKLEPGGDIKKNDMQFSRGNTSGMQFPCENKLGVADVEEILNHGEGGNSEKDGGVELTARQKLKLPNENKDEVSEKNDIQLPRANQLEVADREEILNHGEDDKSEKDGVKLISRQKMRKIKKKMIKNKDEMIKKNDIEVPCGNQLEVADREEILNHGEDDKIEKDGGVELSAGQKMRKIKKKIKNKDEMSKKDDIEVPCGNQLEVANREEILNHGEDDKSEKDGGVKLTAGQKVRKIKKKMIKNKDEMSKNNDIEVPCGNQLEVADREEILNHGVDDKGEKDGGVKLTAGQKLRKRRAIKKKMMKNNDEMSKTNDIEVPCGNQLEVADREGILNHGEDDKSEKDGGVKLTAGEKTNDIEVPCGNQLEVADREEILNHGKDDKGDKDGGVELTAGQKLRKRRAIKKKMMKNKDEMSKKNDIEVPCGNQLEVADREGILNHGEDDKGEKDGAVKLTAGQKLRKRRAIKKKMMKNNDEMSKKNDKEVPCANQLGVAEGGEGEKGEMDCGLRLAAPQKRIRKRKRNKISNISNDETSKKDEDIQVPYGNQLEVVGGEEILDHGDGGVNLAACKTSNRKRRRGRKSCDENHGKSDNPPELNGETN